MPGPNTKSQITIRLLRQLEATGLQVESLGLNLETLTANLVLKPPATPGQQAQANAVIAAFDWLPPPNRRPRSAASIKSDIDAALTTVAQSREALHAFLAIQARNNPKILRMLGLNIDGDEPVP